MNSREPLIGKTQNALRIEKHREMLKANGKAQLNITLPIELHEHIRQFSKNIKLGMSPGEAAEILKKSVGNANTTHSCIKLKIAHSIESETIPHRQVKYSINLREKTNSNKENSILGRLMSVFIRKKGGMRDNRFAAWQALQVKSFTVKYEGFGFHSVPVVTAEQRLAV